MLSIRKASPDELGRLMEIYRTAQDYMIATGNPNQWGHFNPPEERVKEDIRTGISHVIFDESGIHGVFAMCAGEDPTYSYIENGSWLNDGPYITVHRIASDQKVHGVFDCAIEYCKARADNIRIDTHAENRIMQKLIKRNGFKECGTIYLANGSPRMAFQWSRERETQKTH